MSEPVVASGADKQPGQISVKRISQWHSEIYGDGKWIATVNTKIVDAEVVRKAIEEALKK